MESDKGPYEKISTEDYTEEDYLLASTVVYGFSLVDKIWRRSSLNESEALPLKPFSCNSRVQRFAHQTSRMEHLSLPQPRPPPNSQRSLEIFD